ncbi:MAG: hypothetical protein ACI9M3_002212 [Bacteroidia bacterium]|jgi:hypothetical protein
MEDQLEEFEQTIYFSNKEIFTKIWTNPRLVFRYLHSQEYDKFLTPLLILAGIAKALDRASSKGSGDNMSLIGVLLLSIIAGGLLGSISYYIYAALLSWTGKWLKGKSDFTGLLRVLAHGSIPVIVGLVFLIPQIALFGNEVFKTNGDLSGEGIFFNVFFNITVGAQIILSIWTIVLNIIGISEVQEFGIGKAIVNLFLPLFVIVIPILLIILAFKGF